MNKKGHIALAVTGGSAALFLIPQANEQLLPSFLTVAAAAIGGLAPDLDHKTSTASQKIQFSVQKRRLFKRLGLLFLIIGVLALVSSWMIHPPNRFISLVLKSAPLWLGGGILFMLLSHLRSLILVGVGALLLFAGNIYDWHWITSFAGAALMLLPLVKHRGVIHTPEFALALTVGLLSFSDQYGGVVQALGTGFIAGWWMHLIGDCFGREGIHSLILPRVGIALKLFSNGGVAERWIARICWGCSAVCWVVWIAGQHASKLQFL